MKLTRDEQKLILKVAKGYLLAKELVGLPTATIKAAKQLILVARKAVVVMPWNERLAIQMKEYKKLRAKLDPVDREGKWP